MDSLLNATVAVDERPLDDAVIARIPAFTLYTANCTEKANNTLYPNEVTISCAADLAEAARYDHVAARYVGNERRKSGFIESDCLIMDLDNSNGSDDKSTWKNIDHLKDSFPDVAFYVVPSRNDNEWKSSESPRPRKHVYFPIEAVKDAKAYADLKEEMLTRFPFDPGAKDAARFLFGVKNTLADQAVAVEGRMLLTEFLTKNPRPDAAAPVQLSKGQASTAPPLGWKQGMVFGFLEGQRNDGLYRYAGSLRAKGQLTDENALDLLLAENERLCQPPLDRAEVEVIAASVCKLPIGHSPEFDAAHPTATGGKKHVLIGDVKALMDLMGITARLNILSGFVEVDGLPGEYSRTNAANVLPALLCDRFKQAGRYCTRATVDDALTAITDAARFNPVADMLTAAPWDNTNRIGQLYEILGLTPDSKEATYLRKWLHQCIALAVNDEAEPYGADGCLTLQGAQGVGKTRFFQTLAGRPEWFLGGAVIDLDRKDSLIQSTSAWICELGELDSTLKREQSSLKSFITAESDTYRAPYAKTATRKPRRTSFCATVNPREFLRDETGSRRFWVVPVERIDLERLNNLDREWVFQLWRQVYYTLFKVNPQGFRLTARERKRLEADNSAFAKPLPFETELLEAFDWDRPIETWTWARTRDIKYSVPGATANQIGQAVRRIAERDPRIEIKTPKNIKQYLLPVPQLFSVQQGAG